MTAKPRSILLVEDVAETRDWLSRLLQSAFPAAVIHVAAVLREARDLLSRQDFDLALVDLELPDGSGIDLLREITARWPETYCVVATIFDDDHHLFDALRAGARGYLLKEQSDAQITRHLAGILEDQPPLSPAIARRVLGFFGAPADERNGQELTARELEVLSRIARGLLLKEVAHELAISVHTVGDHVKNIYRKLRVRTRAEATVHALRLGLVSPTGE